MKKCSNSKCDQVNPQLITSFSTRKDSKDGLRAYCRTCEAKMQALSHLKHKEERNLNSKEYYGKNKERLLKKQKVLNRKHRAEKPTYGKDYYDKNRERILIQKSIYIQENLSIIVAKNVKRYATKKKRTPPWVTEDHVGEMQKFYVEAHKLTEETGIPHHVDHIIPLQGKDVSGLHVPWNLQILTAYDNISKGNRLPV